MRRGVHVPVRAKIAFIGLCDRVSTRQSQATGIIAVNGAAAIERDGAASTTRGESRVVVAGRYMGFQQRGYLYL